MKRKLQNIAYLLMAAALVTSCGGKKQTSEFPDWAWADFQRPEGINPIISPDTTTFFYCPMRQDSVAWEASDTFNPAALILLLALLGGGGVFAYLKLVKNKPKTKGNDSLDDYDYGEEDSEEWETEDEEVLEDGFEGSDPNEERDRAD